MALSLLESIRKLIRQDTVKVGRPVGNMHGTVRTDLGELTGDVTQTWLAFEVSGSALPTLEEFFDIYASGQQTMSLEMASEGVLTRAVNPNRLLLLRTVVNAPRNVAFTLQVTIPTGGSEAAFYLDGVLLRTLRGQGAVAVNLTPGTHVLYAAVKAPQITIEGPRSLAFVGETDVPPVPRWVSVTTGYLDERAGSASNTLRWVSDAQVSQYRVLRRAPTIVADLTLTGNGQVVSVSTVSVGDTYVIELAGDQTERVALNGVLLANGESIGVVTGVRFDGTNTVVSCRLPVGVNTPPAELDGTLLSTGTFVEIARVSRVANTPTVEYIDSSVTKDVAYEYALRAAGLADETVLSELSDVRYVVTGDVTPPAAIAVASGYPKVLNKTATVRFTTPTDLDYAGVNVYYRRRILNNGAAYTVSSVSGAVVTVNAGTLPITSGGLAGYKVQLNVAGYTAYTFQVASNTSSALTLTDTVPSAIASAGTGVTIAIYKDTAVRTDAGSPNRIDELSFEAIDYGVYYFASFDRAGNEQTFETSATWTYTAADDTFSSPPVLAVRQLSATEQAYFTDPYDNTKQYVVIEVWAYDPQRPDADQFTGVKIYYQRIGQDGSPITMPSVPNQAEAFPNTVTGAGEAVLDNPSGTRSRFILVNREYPQVRLWTENALSQTSDITTFTADHDTTPEATVETSINPLSDSFTFVVVVDDDTQGFAWQVDTGVGTPTVYQVDTRSEKRITVSPNTPANQGGGETSLTLGQRKVLTVVPYATYTPGPPVTLSDPGSSVVRELVRTPRSYVTFDSKDADGDRSATSTTATFAQTPAATTLVTGRTGTVALKPSSTSIYRLTDSASPAWTTNQYRSTSTAFFYLVLKPTNRPHIAVPITESGAATLDTTTNLASYVGIGAMSYEIIDGAVLWRRLVSGTPTGGFAPTLGTFTFPRNETFELEFYATKNGCYPESVRRVLVDEDSLPSLSGFGYSVQTISSKDYLVVGFGSADDDATTWEVYEKKGGWPTVGGQQPSASVPPAQNSLDRTFLRFSGSVDETSYKRSADGLSAGTWYAVAVPKNSFGEAGVASTATYVVGATPTPALIDLVLTPTVGTTTLSAAYPSNAQTPGNTSVSFTAVRQDNGATVTATRTASQTPWPLDVGETIVASGGVNRTWTVTATLSGYNTLTRTATFQVAQATGSNVTLQGVTATVYDAGNCFVEQCGNSLSRGHTRLISWQVRLNGVLVSSMSSPYYVNIEVTNEPTITAQTTWVPLVYGLPAAQFSHIDSSFCLYSATGGFTEYWTYRITVTDANGTSLGVSAQTSRLTDTLLYCGSSGPGNPPLEF